ncbi:MAG: hypothetical protein HYV95_04860 [Opitutae bacterium]|nr:hypothetical protein [Opitutae bacterium]
MNSSDRHLRFGWWSLFFWLALGLGLEALHGFKAGWYLDVGQEMRRLMLTLAHAHGTLLALVNLAAGFTLRTVKGAEVSRPASWSLLGAGVLLPLGFLLGGLQIYGGDPGVGVLLVPVGGLLLLYGVAAMARAVQRATRAAK